MSTMENEKYIAIGAGQQIADTGEINAVIELGECLLTSNRTTNTLVLYNMSLEEITRRSFTRDEIGCFGTVKDMVKISSSRFAVLMSNCELWIMELNDDFLGFRLVDQLPLAKNSSSICYQSNYIFAAVTGFARPSFIQQTSIEGLEHGHKSEKSAKRRFNHILFRKSIRILDVDPDFVMYVCDRKHKHLYIFGKDNFSDSLMISEETTHRYRVMDIARSAKGATYIATDSSDGVVLLSKNREWTFNNFLPKSKLGGTPTAVAFIEAPSPRLVVAVTSGWLPGWLKRKTTKIVLFELVQRKQEKSLNT